MFPETPILVFLALATVLISNSAAELPGHFERIGWAGGKTFYTSVEGANLTWYKSKAFCEEHGMRLGEPHTRTEEELLFSNMRRSDNSIEKVWFWIGARDVFHNRVLNWETTLEEVNRPVYIPYNDYECGRLMYQGSYRGYSCVLQPPQGTMWPLCEIDGAVFECTSRGKHADPNSCAVFHECIPYNGNFIDYKMDCAPGTTYCQKEQVCGHPTDCPCPGDDEGVKYECPSAGKHGDPNNCKKYHTCSATADGFKDVEGQCGSGYNYCAKEQVCGPPWECPCLISSQ